MKSLLILPLLIGSIICKAHSDTIILGGSRYVSTYIQTPKNTNVLAFYLIDEDYTIYEAATIDNAYLLENPGAILLESSSKRFNCHAFAWYIINGGGDPLLIDGETIGILSTFWNDSSFIETNTISEATIIAYKPTPPYVPDIYEHSLICTEDSDTVISKWGFSGPTMKHHKEVGPWKASNYIQRYFKLNVQRILGPENICGEVSYILDSFINTTRSSWSSDSLLNIISSSNISIAVEPISSVAYGYNGYVEAVLSTVYENIDEGEDVVIVIDTLRKEGLHVSNQPSNVQIHVPVEPIYGEVEAMVWASSDPGEESYDWQVSGGTIISETGLEMTLIADCPSRRGITIGVKAINECGESAWVYRTVEIDCTGGINPLSILPNPADGYVDLTIDQTMSESVQYYDGKYEISVIDQSGILKFSTITFDNHLRIDTQNFIDGIYYIILKYAGKRYGRQLIISH